ncbi:unnamed protein product [marine sediment metagenome]|uniref:Uncharacterized protein n=1 Tax=marine sediment metagenome TaxID=412755 RepID=X0SG62_9ZZZZ
MSEEEEKEIIEKYEEYHISMNDEMRREIMEKLIKLNNKALLLIIDKVIQIKKRSKKNE